MSVETELAALEARLNDFAPGVRRAALAGLVDMAARGEVALPPEAEVANMHCHTFFSFNAYGHSPSSLAWLARRRGYRLAGIVDFDVLDGVDEFLAACDVVGTRGSAAIETRIFVPEFGAQEINSPGEPGVCYHMGIGFASGRVPAHVVPALADLRARAARRNREVIDRVNAHLQPVTVDYERDVLPLTPARNPTERHIVLAYVQAVARGAPDPAGFWASRLALDTARVAAVMGDGAAFQNLVRARLMKRGGPGYVQPDAGAFPTLADFHRLIVACGALPCAAWLDGTTAAEQDIDRWLAFLVDNGARALNIIPDRNWNIPDPETRRVKVQNLYRVVDLARALDLPLHVGTEMNSFGQKLVDGFDTPELAPVRGAFLDGAYFAYGHTALQRALGWGYQSEWAAACLPGRRERNSFYTRAGRLLPPGQSGLARLARLGSTSLPADVLRALEGRQ